MKLKSSFVTNNSIQKSHFYDKAKLKSKSIIELFKSKLSLSQKRKQVRFEKEISSNLFDTSLELTIYLLGKKLNYKRKKQFKSPVKRIVHEDFEISESLLVSVLRKQFFESVMNQREESWDIPDDQCLAFYRIIYEINSDYLERTNQTSSEFLIDPRISINNGSTGSFTNESRKYTSPVHRICLITFAFSLLIVLFFASL
eukprot:NODE_548_length_6182_cov_1.284564.p4 type:complete len:200 gc:universal NODE_548_length_6182_cov_1.284564:162-761(+)